MRALFWLLLALCVAVTLAKHGRPANRRPSHRPRPPPPPPPPPPVSTEEEPDTESTEEVTYTSTEEETETQSTEEVTGASTEEEPDTESSEEVTGASTEEEPNTESSEEAEDQCDVASQRASSGFTRTDFTSQGYFTVQTTCYPPKEIYDWYPIPFNGNNMPSNIKTRTVRIPLNPQKAASPTHFAKGTVGITFGGMCIFDACTSGNKDAMKTEIFDDCNGHADPNGFYHTHGKPKTDSSCPCDFFQDNAVDDSSLTRELGWALDGFPIVSDTYPDGTVISSSSLDECHGMQFTNDYYAYVIQDKEGQNPYTVGCFMGTPLDVNAQSGPTDCTATPEDGPQQGREEEACAGASVGEVPGGLGEFDSFDMGWACA